MKGKYSITVYNNRIRYELEIERNITVIKGNSGTGKTTLYSMFRDLLSTNRYTGVKCNCRDKIKVLDNNSDWKRELSINTGKIFLSDEDTEYITTQEFAESLNSSDNYFIFITRSGRMSWLTYSVDCIYELGTEKVGNVSVTKMYKRYFDIGKLVKPDLVISEDSNSGFEMFNLVFDCDVVSAKGRDRVYSTLKSYINRYKTIYVIVDGSAFGSCIGRLIPFLDKGVSIFAPESVEYLMLLSDTFERYLTSELTETYNFCDSIKYLSWERYYTELLKTICKSNYGFSYSKKRLNNFFKSEYFINHIKNQLTDIDFN